MENRPNHRSPLTFKVNYYVTGKPPKEDGKGYGRAIVVQECTDIINLQFLEVEEKDKNAIMDFMYELKGLFEEKIVASLGLEGDPENIKDEPEEAKVVIESTSGSD
ncbi:MAG: hypothetical protein ACW99U_12675 [Candidatus Thorarchaeota archaeon]